MNERIQELAERAGFKLIRENCYDVVSTMSVQEFAELIVQDCANFVRESYDHADAEGIAWYMEIKYGLHGDYA